MGKYQRSLSHNKFLFIDITYFRYFFIAYLVTKTNKQFKTELKNKSFIIENIKEQEILQSSLGSGFF